MDFEKELDKRLIDVYKYKEERKKMEEARQEQALIIKTKNIIDSVLQTVAAKFKNEPDRLDPLILEIMLPKILVL